MARILSTNPESDISSALATLSIALAAAVLLPACQRAPLPQYITTAPVVAQRTELTEQLLALLPASIPYHWYLSTLRLNYYVHYLLKITYMKH